MSLGRNKTDLLRAIGHERGGRYNSIFGEPAPTLEIAPLVDVVRNLVFTSAGVKLLSCCKSKATAPATCGQAMDVPLIAL